MHNMAVTISITYVFRHKKAPDSIPLKRGLLLFR
jgi:hypothetical protein